MRGAYGVGGGEGRGNPTRRQPCRHGPVEGEGGGGRRSPPWLKEEAPLGADLSPRRNKGCDNDAGGGISAAGGDPTTTTTATSPTDSPNSLPDPPFAAPGR